MFTRHVCMQLYNLHLDINLYVYIYIYVRIHKVAFNSGVFIVGQFYISSPPSSGGSRVYNPMARTWAIPPQRQIIVHTQHRAIIQTPTAKACVVLQGVWVTHPGKRWDHKTQEINGSERIWFAKWRLKKTNKTKKDMTIQNIIQRRFLVHKGTSLGIPLLLFMAFDRWFQLTSYLRNLKNERTLSKNAQIDMFKILGVSWMIPMSQKLSCKTKTRIQSNKRGPKICPKSEFSRI